MSKGRRPTRPAPSPEGDLLREAACSYVEAYGAVITLHEIVRDRTRAAVARRLTEYAAALGVPLEPGRLLPYQGPKPADWDGTWASLGCQVKKLGTARCWLYHTLD